MSLTLDQIRAAQANSLDGISAVLGAMESRIAQMADKEARGFTMTPERRADYAEEFRQDAAVALFDALPRWSGNTVDQFYAFMYSTLANALKASAHAIRNPGGVDAVAMMTFRQMVELTNGNVAEAERLAQTEPAPGRRLSAERAHACRLAWAGTVSADTPIDSDGQTIADFLVADAEAAPEVNPKVGHGAALEALSVLRRYAGLKVRLGSIEEFVTTLPSLADTLEDVISVPRDPEARRYVLDAMAILRSAVSTATDSEVVDDLRTVADERADERAAKVHAVRSILNAMGEGQREVLVHTFGIAGAQEFGHGDKGDDVGLAEAIGSDVKSVRDRRTKGLKTFAKRWIKATASDDAQAEALEVAAAVNLGRRGRK